MRSVNEICRESSNSGRGGGGAWGGGGVGLRRAGYATHIKGKKI